MIHDGGGAAKFLLLAFLTAFLFRPRLTNGHGILKSMNGRSLWVGIAFLEGAASRLRKKLGFVIRVLAILNR